MDRIGQESNAGRLLGGRYRLAHVVGQGTTGTVWAAHDDVLGRDVAVKHVPDAGSLLAGLQEARLAARAAGPHVVQVFDAIVDGGHAWIVMQLLPGRTLADALAERHGLPQRKVARLALDLLAALAAVHAAGVVHRDVAPENVMFDPHGRAVLVDFGAAAPIGNGDARSPGRPASAGLAPPEVTHGGPTGTAGDVWTLGATLLAALRGQVAGRPLRGVPAPPPRTEDRSPRPDAYRPCPNRPISILALISTLLAEDPGQRPSVEQVRAAVLRYLVETSEDAGSRNGASAERGTG